LLSAGCEEILTRSLIKLLHCFCLCFADVNLVNKSTSNVVMKSEAERMNALGKALALVLDGAEIKQTRKNSVIASFLEAFEGMKFTFILDLGYL
jgi:hypothetical protein